MPATRSGAIAVAALVSCVSVALAEDAIKAGEQKAREEINPCATFGPGYNRLAGTETCIKIGGSVRIDFGAGDIERRRRSEN